MSDPAGHVPGPGGFAGFPGNLLSRPPDTRTRHLALHEALRVLRYENQGPWTLSSTPGADGSGRCRGPGRARGPDTRPSRSPPQTFRLRGLRGAGQRRAPGSARHLAASMKILRHRSLKGHGSWAHSSLPHLEGMQLPESAAVLGHHFGRDAGHGRPAGGAGRGPLAGGLPGATHWAARCTGVKGEGTGVAGGGACSGSGDRPPARVPAARSGAELPLLAKPPRGSAVPPLGGFWGPSPSSQVATR